MSSEDKRIIEQTASTTVPDDAFFIFDSALLGTFKISGAILKALLGANGTQALEEIANAIAEEYDSTHTYAYNSWVFHEGVLYRCISQSVTGTWDATKWQAKTIKEFIDTAKNLVLGTIEQMFGEYLPISTLDPPSIAAISKGDIFIYQRTNKYKFYRAKADHPQGVTEFDIDDWDEFDTVADLIEDVSENAGKVDDVKVDGVSVVDENKVAQINGKANVDGVYELVAGNIMSDSYETDNAPYLYRVSHDGSAVEDKLVGGTAAWNQQITSPSSRTSSDITLTKLDDGTCKVNGIADGTAIFYCGPGNSDIILGHKYYVSGCPSGGSDNTYMLSFRTNGASTIIGNETGSGKVFTFTDSSITNRSMNVLVRIMSGTTVNNLIYMPVVVDLTQAFGSTIADYVYTLEQATEGSGIAWFKANGFLTKDYYAYDAGSLQSVKTSAKKIVGENLFDTTNLINNKTINSLGNLATYGGRVSTPNYISVVPNTNVVLTYDKNTSENIVFICALYKDGTMVSRTSGNSTGTTINTGECNQLRLTFYVSNETNITIDNLSNIQLEFGSTATTYSPYKAKSYPLDSDLTLRGIPKLDANNNLYYDGDTYESDGSVTRKYGVVDLGDYNFNLSGSGHFFASISDLDNNDIICLKYTRWNDWTTFANQDKVAMYYDGYLRIKDSSYSTAQDFNNSTSGIELVYKKQTETSETADTFENPQLVYSGGTEEYVDTRDVPIPVGHESKYYLDIKGKVEQLYGIPEVPSTNGTYTLKATRSASGVAYNWVSG